MIERVVFDEEFRCFEKGTYFDLSSGINILVGDQGAGKTTLLESILLTSQGKRSEVLLKMRNPSPVLAYDAERHNPRTLFVDAFSTAPRVALSTRLMSHGQAMNFLLEGVLKSVRDLNRDGQSPSPVVLLDEPDIGLSIRSCYRLIGALYSLAEISAQVLCAVHNPTVIEHFEHVLDVEERRWRSGERFILSQKGPWDNSHRL